VCTLLEKKTSVRVFGLNKLFLKDFLRLDLQPVQLIFPTSITYKKIHQPSKDILFRERAHRGRDAWGTLIDTKSLLDCTTFSTAVPGM
jgi:hypothetical protein